MKTVINACFTMGDKLLAAQEAVAQLKDLGIAARSITINGARPVIVIDRPRNTDALQGVQHLREHRGGLVARSIKAAIFHGCQVEWDECVATGYATQH